MRNRVERLRVWLLGSAVLLMLVIAAYIGAARHLRHRLFAKVPAKLGINVQSDASGYTLSHYDDRLRRTTYTLHAAKEIGYTDGKFSLHDVSVVLYGKKGDRRDRIYGQDFEYDQKDGVIRALGVVHIDLQAADAGGGAAAASAEPEDAGASGSAGTKVMHVTTSGLVYLDKLGVASTDEPIQFEAGAMTGHATGADYSSDSGLLTLHSAVSMSGVAGNRPVDLTAATAEFDERRQQAFLTHAQYESPGEGATAEQATLYRRPDGTLSRVDAKGNVTVQAQGATTVSQRADVMLNGASQPQSARLTGGVLYSMDEPLRQARGQADEATITFDKEAKPRPEHALLTGAVHMIERTRATEAAREPWTVRDLTAEKFVAELTPAGRNEMHLRDAEASGNAHLTMVDNGSLAGNAGAGRRELSADDLKAHLRETGDAKQSPQLDTIAGRGHTVLRELSADGVEQTSTGDTLDAKFRPKAGKTRPAASVAAAGRPAGGARDLGTAMLASAMQQGHVTMMRREPAKQGSAAVNAGDEVRHAVAERAAYDGDLDRLTLTGGVQMTDAGSMLWANQVALDRATGDAHALGAVKVDYAQDSTKAAAGNGRQQNTEPTHILADRAELEHAADITTFYGKPVRLWQGGSQVQAPEVELSQDQKRLIARGAASTGWSGAIQAAQVHTVLVSPGADAAGAQSAPAGKDATAQCAPGARGTGPGRTAAGGAAGAPQAVRIASGGLIYSGILGQADFTGGVRAETVDATIRSSQAIAYLAQASGNTPSGAAAGKPPAASAAGVPSLGGPLERVVATGHVGIDRPGLQATGERLVYTARDQVFLLTGDKNAPPKAVDAQGTTTGAALRMHNTCDASGGVSVEALGEVPGEPAQRVHTESRVQDDRKKEIGRK